MKFLGKYVEVSPTLLDFYVAGDRGGQQDGLVAPNFNGQNEQAPPAPDHAGGGGEAARADGAKVMNGEISGRNSLVKFKLTEDRKGRGRIDQRSDGASVNYALVLQQFVPDRQVDSHLTRADFAQFETDELRVWNRSEGFARSCNPGGIQFFFTHVR